MFISVTWSFLIISIIIFFGTIIGLGMALKKISKLNFAITILIYSIIISVLLFIMNLNISLLCNPINRYITEIIGIIGFLVLLAGILTIKNWKLNKKITYLNNPAFLFPIIGGILGITSVYTMLIYSNSGYSIELIVAIVLALLLTIVVAFGFSKFLKKLKKPYPLIISNFMVLVGFYFIMFAAFIPNIATLSSMQMNPLYVKSSNYVVFLLIAVAGIFLCGVFMQSMRMQKRTML